MFYVLPKENKEIEEAEKPKTLRLPKHETIVYYRDFLTLVALAGISGYIAIKFVANPKALSTILYKKIGV